MCQASAFRIRRSGGRAQSAKRVGSDETCEPRSGPPVPEKAQPIGEAVGLHFRPVRLGPGEQMEGSLQQGPGRIIGTRVLAEGIERGRSGVVPGQRALDRCPPGRGLGREGATPSTKGAARRVAAGRAAPLDLGPGGAVFKAGNDDGLNYFQQVMPIAEEEAGQEGERVTTGFTQPAFDGDRVHRGRREGLAPIKPMADEELSSLTVRTDFGTGEDKLGEMSDVLLDRTMEFGYNDHARSPVRRKPPSLSLRVGLFYSPVGCA